MRQLDRYMLHQTLTAFAFFCLILAGVIWLTQAVRLIDTVLSSGQSLWRLVEFSLLVLPRVLSMVLPLAGFAAVIYTINKLYSEAELVVMMMSGQGPFALARPILLFALLMGLITLVITNLLTPYGDRRLDRNRQELRSELANALIREGRFLHPAEGLTIFIREASDTGQMAGLFLNDARDAERPVTYTAEQALLVRDGNSARLIMSRGVALSGDGDGALGRIQFEEFSYDLSDLIAPVSDAPTRASGLPTLSLLFPDDTVRGMEKYKPGNFTASGHERLVFGLHAFLLPLLGLSVMLTGGYQRRGFGFRIIAAVLSGVFLVVAGLTFKSVVIATPSTWILMYLPDLLAIVVIVFLLARSTRPMQRKAVSA